MRSEQDFVAKGNLAKKILEEIQRPPTKAEIDHLRNAMKNRVKKKIRNSKDPT